MAIRCLHGCYAAVLGGEATCDCVRVWRGGFGSGSAFAGRGCQGRLESVGGRDWHLLSLSLTSHCTRQGQVYGSDLVHDVLSD